ncbi:MAG: AhpC/TSA family protein [Bacteroidaceae bacterium]|nr:AhpC/TSA family protein [Bacteroidaceae bacterium]
MKRIFLFLLAATILFSCSKNGKSDNAAGQSINGGNDAVCTINGRYASAPDGTMLYMTPIDDILAPVDSAVVENGCFTFTSSDTALVVRYISSQQVIDGGYIVLEPGVVNVDFAADVFASGTPKNERLNRFMGERAKIVHLRQLSEPASLDMLGIDVAMRDSLNDVLVMANEIFDAYALKEIKENIATPVGYFYLVQSAGVASPAKLLPMFDKVPVQFRDKLYDVMKKKVENTVVEAAMADKYLDEMVKSLDATAVGKKFQNFELNNIKGGTVLLSDEVFSNKYTLVLFWACWQKGAGEILQAMSSHYDKYKEKGLQIVGVSLDDSVSECKTFADNLGCKWIQLCNPMGGSAEVAAAYGITELPAAVLVNNRGTIIARMSTVVEIARKFEELF